MSSPVFVSNENEAPEILPLQVVPYSNKMRIMEQREEQNNGTQKEWLTTQCDKEPKEKMSDDPGT